MYLVLSRIRVGEAYDVILARVYLLADGRFVVLQQVLYRFLKIHTRLFIFFVCLANLCYGVLSFFSFLVLHGKAMCSVSFVLFVPTLIEVCIATFFAAVVQGVLWRRDDGITPVSEQARWSIRRLAIGALFRDSCRG